MDKEILEILESIQESQKRLEDKINDIREDLGTVQIITAKNWKDLIELKNKNLKLDDSEDKYQQVTKINENINSIKKDIEFIENTISKNCYDIKKLFAIK